LVPLGPFGAAELDLQRQAALQQPPPGELRLPKALRLLEERIVRFLGLVALAE
jgi:hypothetical protein